MTKMKTLLERMKLTQKENQTFDEDEEEEIDEDVEMYKGGEDDVEDTDGMDYGEEEG